MAPHRYPFLLIDPLPAAAAGSPPDRAVVRLTAAAAALRGEGPLSLFLLLEVAAQAVLHLLGGKAGEGEVVLLAGVEEMSLAEGAEARPPAAGDTLLVRAAEEARMGRLIKVRVEIDRDDARLATGILLLATG